jgi:hypothetical protein
LATRDLRSERLFEKSSIGGRDLTITHNFLELQERPKGQIVDNKKGAADNKL